MNPAQQALADLQALNTSVPALASAYDALVTQNATLTQQLIDVQAQWDALNQKYAALVNFIDAAYALAHPPTP